MSVVAVAVVGSAVVGAYSANKSAKAQKKAAGKAADAQTESNTENIEFQREVFEQQRADNEPWRQAGMHALERLQAGMAEGKYKPSDFKFDFKADPGYSFRLQEGVNALDASASSRGRLRSGAQDKAVTRYASNLASQEYGNAFNRAVTTHSINEGAKTDEFNQLATVAGIGQTANQATQAARSNMGANVGNSITATGNAIAGGHINAGNATASGYQGMATAANQGIQNYLLYSKLG